MHNVTHHRNSFTLFDGYGPVNAKLHCKHSTSTLQMCGASCYGLFQMLALRLGMK